MSESVLSPGVRPPLMVLSPDDQGPKISVATFIVLSITIETVVVRLISMLCLKRRPAMEDIAIWIATSLYLAQCTLVQLSINHGLGRHVNRLSEKNFEQYNKFHYASEILFILVLATAKLSVSLLINKFALQKQIRLANWVILGITGAWTVFSIFSIAFQCKSPHLSIYAPDRCAGQGALYYLIGVFNILTDLALVITPIFVLWSLQLPLSTRALVMGGFISRGFVAIIAITQLFFLPSYLRSKDPTWTVADVTICNELMIGVSIITACLPALHHVLTNISTGGIRIPAQLGISAGQSYGYGRRTATQNMHSHGHSSKGSFKFSLNCSHSCGHKKSFKNYTGNTTNVSAASNYSTSSARRQERREGLGISDSTKRLTMNDGTVMKTTDFTVDIEQNTREYSSKDYV